MRHLLTLAALALAVWSPCASVARADTCWETAQVNIDCSAKSAAPAAPKQGAPQNALRDQLLRSLGSSPKAAGPAASPEALAKAVHNAQDRAQSALDAAAKTSDPIQRQKLSQSYKAAMKDLNTAYDKAAAAADTPEGRAQLLAMKQADDQRYAEAADRQIQPPAAVRAETPNRGPDNVGASGGYVYACDGPVDGPHVSCREIQPDGRSCIAVIAFDGVINVRDSTATPCGKKDLAQRDEFFRQNPDAAVDVKMAAQPAFTMDPTETEAEIRRLTADMGGPKQLDPDSPECRAFLQVFVAASAANNGPGSEAAYEALQKVGGCGALPRDQVKATPLDPRFVQRGDTPMLDQTAVPCDQNPQACAAAVSQLRAGTSPEAVTALYANAIQIGLQVGTALGSAVLNAQQMNIPNSPASRPVASNGGARPRAPSPDTIQYHPRPPVPPCAIGGKGWCTAQ